MGRFVVKSCVVLNHGNIPLRDAEWVSNTPLHLTEGIVNMDPREPRSCLNQAKDQIREENVSTAFYILIQSRRPKLDSPTVLNVQFSQFNDVKRQNTDVAFSLQPQDKNEQLSIKVDYLENKVTHLSTSNTDLSSRLVHSEEEKLKVAYSLFWA